MKLNKATTITNESKFIKGHTSVINHHGIDHKLSKPYLERLETFCKLKKINIKTLLKN